MRVGTQNPPWRVIRAFPVAGGASLVHLHNVSGGVLGGDCLSLDVKVESAAQAQITTTGATRIYRHRTDARSSEQHTSIAVAPEGLLEYLPDALIPYAESRHRQRTVVTLGDRATFIWWEVLAPGRQAMGEEFAFDNLHVETQVRTHDHPILLENFNLDPRSRSLRSVVRLGDYAYTASFYAFQVGRPLIELRELESQLSEIARVESHAGTIWGASALASDGVIVRGLSATSRNLAGHARPVLGYGAAFPHRRGSRSPKKTQVGEPCTLRLGSRSGF